MRKIIFFISFFILVTFLRPSSANAIAKFNTAYQTYYKVEENGNTHVTFVVNQTNNLSIVYATEYGISINETKIKNVKVSDEGVLITPEVSRGENQTTISFPFAKKVVGKDKVHRFSIEYDTEDIVNRQGNTWQINIPRFESDENITDQTAILVVPEGFSQPAYIDPKPDLINGNNYYFSSKILANKPISAIFGKNQYYKSSLDYYIQNSQNSKIETYITLPPNTSYQSVYYEKIEPFPERIEKDPDGNVLAYYQLSPNESKQITAQLYFKTDFLPRQNIVAKNSTYIEKNKIWNYDDNLFTIPEVKGLSSPKAIYDYVSSKLEYDYQKINRDGTVRIPASESLKNFHSAICTDFTDLYVTLARKAGIPARELEGLALSENPDLKPISTTQDVLHAWPEFYNETIGNWVQVDPTWGSTTRGIDYFNKLDFNHLVFAIHGTSPDKPFPAGAFKNPSKKSKDIKIEAITEISLPKGEIKINSLSKNSRWYDLQIQNTSGVFVTGPLEVSETKYTEKYLTEVNLAPFEKQTIKLKSIGTLFASQEPEAVIIKLNEQQLTYQFESQSLYSKSYLFAIISLILGIITWLTRGLLLRRRK